MVGCAFALSLLALYLSSPVVFVAAEPASIPKAVRPFSPGERFTYSIAWFRLGAGNAVLEVAESPPIHGQPTLKLLTTATSGPIVTTFYPVDNRVESVVDAASLRPYRFVFHRREGKKKNDFDVIFHHAEGHVAATKDGQTETLPIPPDAHDPISVLYYVRSLPSLTPGSSHVLNVHHDKKNYRVEIKVEEIEKVKGPWGKVEAIRVLAIMPFQGIFLNEGNIQVWLTNDARRIPVMMKAKVVIGSVVARLVEGFQAP
ncbi:MAG TPA: DUF3108 domain-containing protein [Nitrospiraceae bacterium]|jgi:hypothetical protein|nr:DUF3108 domain-containing protein [Nitrospiraceae bacterium]